MADLPLILGHRGSSALAPENTLAAFARAVADGADGIEFDVRLARDEVPVVIHDATLNRTARIDGRVSDLTSKELQKIDVGSWFPGCGDNDPIATQTIPTLAKVFEMFEPNDSVLYVEMKCEPSEGVALATNVASLIGAMDMNDRVVVESFNLAATAHIKRIAPAIRTSALFEPKLSQPRATLQSSRIVDLALKHGADELALHHSLARLRLIQLAHQRGLDVVVWTVDNPSWVDRARLFGVKGLIANDPAPLVQYRNG